MRVKTNVKCDKCSGLGGYDVYNSAWIKFRRKELGLSLRDLGLKVKLSAMYLCDIEKGRRNCPKKLSDFLNEA